MKKIKYNNLDETVYYKKLDNGFRIYLYPTKKTKNFYITVSTRYGSSILKYKQDNKINEVIPGTAHFLEHRIMDFTKNRKAMEEINNYGSLPNAYTTYEGTNYNLFGSINIKDNIKMLYDRVFYPNIQEQDVKMERGIIKEEIDMTNDDVMYKLTYKLQQNIFNNLYPRISILGEKQDIDKITHKYLNKIYNTFYTLDNMFTVICGDFDKDDILNYIEEYINKVKTNSIKDIKIIKQREKEGITIPYEEITFPVEETKIIYGLKLKISDFPKLNIFELKSYIGIILMSLFDSTSELREILYEKEILKFGYNQQKVDNYIMIMIKASTKNSNDFERLITKELNNIIITEEEFERKKKALISNLIMSFEDILDIEDTITNNVLRYNIFINNTKDKIYSLKYKELLRVIKQFNINNKCIVKIIKD